MLEWASVSLWLNILIGVHGAVTALAEGWSYRLGYGEQKLDLAEGKLTVGRSRDCDVSIQEPSISRKHVFLTVGSGKILLQDLGSSNGTFTNSRRVRGEAELRDGDVLRLGDAELEVDIESSVPEEARGDPAPPAAGAPYALDEPETVITGDDSTSLIDFSEQDLAEIRGPRPGFWERVAAALGTLVKRT